MASLPRLTGFPPATGHHGTAPESAPARPAMDGWISDELIAETRRTWSVAYGKVISVEEAVEILNNVKRLAGVLLRAVEEGQRT